MKKLAYLYVLASIIIGPGILLYGENLYPHKPACFDQEYNLHPFFENTVHQYKVTQLHETLPSALLIIIGAILLTLLIRLSRKKSPHESYATAIVLVIIMMVGYGLIIGMAALMTACVS